MTFKITIGQCQGDLGRHDEARAIYREVIKLDPTCASAYFVLAFDLSGDDDKTGAIDVYRKFLELYPDDINNLSVHENLAQCLIVQGDLSNAEDICRAGIELETRGPKLDVWDAHKYMERSIYCDLGDCLFAQGDFNGACEAYEKALKLKSYDADSMIKFAKCLLEIEYSPIGISREQLLKKAAKSIKNELARGVTDFESVKAAEGPNYLAENKKFVYRREALYLILRDCCNAQNDSTGAAAAYVKAVAYDSDADSDDDDDAAANQDPRPAALAPTATSADPVVSGAVAAAVLLKHNVDKTVALICTLVLLKYHP